MPADADLPGPDFTSPDDSPAARPPRKVSGVAILALVVLAIFAGGYLLGRSGGQGGAEGGRASIKDISLADFASRIKQMKGNPAVVNFWASWCGPCRKEAPALQRAYDKYKSKGLQVLGVNSGDTTAGADGFLKEFKIRYPNVRDGSDEISVAYRVNGLPTTFFYDSDGDLVDTAVGALDEKAFNQYLADFVEQ